jgi:hypothetical protein
MSDSSATLLSIPAVAKKFSISERLVKRLIATGELKSVKLCSRRLVHIKDCDDYEERLRAEARDDL